MKNKVLWFDVETTGTNPEKHSIIQIAGLIEQDGEITEEFNFFVAPIEGSEIVPSALEVGGFTEEQIKGFPEPENVRRALCQVFDNHVDRFDKRDKFIIAGYNVKFDTDFLYHFFKRLDDGFLGSYLDWNRVIDVFPLVRMLRAIGKIETENTKLSTVAEYYRVTIDAHDALSDVRATRKVFQRIYERYFQDSIDDSKNIHK